MEKEFIPYDQALELKELGFDEPCFGLYAPPCKTISLHHYGLLTAKEQILAPLYQQAFRWFREKYNIDSWITKEHKYRKPFCWYIQDNITIYNSDLRTNGLTYETFFQTHKEAELECLKKLIEIVKKQKEDESNIIV
jgi:hypothetical protein